MKINNNLIDKLQGGGLFVSYTPSQYPATGSQQKEETEKKDDAPSAKGATGDETLEKKLLGAGITSDVKAYMSVKRKAMQEFEALPSYMKNSLQGRELAMASQYNIEEINELMRLKADKDDAEKTATTNNKNLGDLAYTHNGVMVFNTKSNTIQSISFGQFEKEVRNEESIYRTLTNSDLLRYREYASPYDNSSMSALRYSLGSDKVRDEVTAAIKNLGESTVGGASQQYNLAGMNSMVARAKKAEEDKQQIQEAAAEGVFKRGYEYEKMSNGQQLKAALESMWANLSPSAKDHLRLKAISEGYTGEESLKRAYALAASMLQPAFKSSTKEKSTVDYDQTMSRSYGASSEKTEELGAWMEAYSGYGDHEAKETSVTDANGKPIYRNDGRIMSNVIDYVLVNRPTQPEEGRLITLDRNKEMMQVGHGSGFAFDSNNRAVPVTQIVPMAGKPKLAKDIPMVYDAETDKIVGVLTESDRGILTQVLYRNPGLNKILMQGDAVSIPELQGRTIKIGNAIKMKAAIPISRVETWTDGVRSQYQEADGETSDQVRATLEAQGSDVNFLWNTPIYETEIWLPASQSINAYTQADNLRMKAGTDVRSAEAQAWWEQNKGAIRANDAARANQGLNGGFSADAL